MEHYVFSSIFLSNDSFLMLKQEAYKSMASALSEADGIDYTDPEEVSSKSMIPKSCYFGTLFFMYSFGFNSLSC